jgi:hypothetical protein
VTWLVLTGLALLFCAACARIAALAVEALLLRHRRRARARLDDERRVREALRVLPRPRIVVDTTIEAGSKGGC